MLPRHLMKDRLTVYRGTPGKTSKSYSTTPLFANVPCMVQPATSEVVLDYGRHDERVSHSVFTLDATAFAGVSLEDRIVIDSLSFVVKGRKDLSGLGRVFQIDVIEESK